MKRRDYDAEKKVLEDWCNGLGESEPCMADLKFLLESMKDRSYPDEEYLGGEILQMIESSAKPEGHYPACVELKKPEAKDERAYYEFLNQVLKVENGAVGEYNAQNGMGLMEKVITQLALRRGREACFDRYGRMLSVSVKPEKKKEIIRELLANDMVERAKYLASYDDPDWAFDRHKFLNGNREDKTYSSEAEGWYSFKEDRINDHGMLLSYGDEKTMEGSTEYHAVPLGKPEHRKLFYEKVLQPLEKECYASREMIVERKNKYAEVQKEFLAQWELVQKLQKELGEFQFKMIRVLDDKAARERTLADAKSTIEHNEQLIADAETVMNGYNADRKSLDEAMEEMSRKIDEETGRIKELEKQINEYKQKTTEGFAKSEETLKSVNVMTKLLSKKKYDAAVELSDQYHKEACDAQDKDLELSREAKKLGEMLHELLDQQAQMEEKRASFTEEIAGRTREINTYKTTIQKKQQEITETEALLKETLAELDKLNEAVKQQGESGQRVVLDRAFMARLFSEEQKDVEKALGETPWITPKYNTEREKLYHLAEKLIGEFARSSRHVRENLITLEQYWGLRMGDDGQKIEFQQMDKNVMTAALYQTVYLLTPAIAVLWGDVPAMLEGVKKPGIFGRVMVEGYADANEKRQKVTGTLFRARQAVLFT